MSVKIRIPAPLRKLVQEQSVVDIEGTTVQEIINNLDIKYPGFKDRICDESGEIRRFVNIFVNGEDIRHKQGSQTVLIENAEVTIIPAIAGGI